MISTVTINPAVDYNLSVEEIKLDKVNRVEFMSKVAAGKGINVAKAVKNLGQKTEALGCIGGAAGEYIVEELEEEQIASDFNWVENETRINFKLIDNLKQETKINQSGLPLTQEEREEIFTKVIEQEEKSDLLVLGGSLPQDTPDDFYQRLIKALKRRDTKVFLDTSGQPLKLALEAEPTLIKPNLRELEEIWEQELSFREAISVSQELIDSGIEIVVVSLGAEGALLVGDEEVWYAKAPPVEVVSTVGAGDSMVGALAVAYTRGYSLKKMLQFAVAMSIATILLAGSELGSLEEVERWMEKVEVRQMEG